MILCLSLLSGFLPFIGWKFPTYKTLSATSKILAFLDTESSGKLFVVAAGDDISKSDRVAVLVNAWVAAGSPEGALDSGREVFRNGRTIAHEPPKRYHYSDRVLEGYAHSHWLPAAAPTCAYTRGIFERFGPLLGGSIIEGALLLLRAALVGGLLPANSHWCARDYTTPTPELVIQSKMIAFRNMQIDLARYPEQTGLELGRQIEQRILSVLHSASSPILPETRSISWLIQIRHAFRIITAPAVARSFRI